MLKAISPIDGRYVSKTNQLQEFFSEYALIKYRIKVEIEYFIFLHDLAIIEDSCNEKLLRALYENFDLAAAERVKKIEKITNHDVKAVEYYIKEQLVGTSSEKYAEFIHFGLTSQDINNTATPMMLMDATKEVLIPSLQRVITDIEHLYKKYKSIPLLARTHGQPATPTTLGKEMAVYVERLQWQTKYLRDADHSGKFGGATGAANAHRISYPNIHWPSEFNKFLAKLGLRRQQMTTQIEHYDEMAKLFHDMSRINTILIDFCRDIWSYISMNFFKQKVVATEVGSSAMPHKVNPIDFENAEGNLAIANAIFGFLAEKLPLSRLQRDLTDSTVSRNIGVPFSHTLIALKSLQKGISKLEVNETVISADLNENWAVVAEALQTVLRREGYPKPYEKLKEFSRGKSKLTQSDFVEFIDSLEVTDDIKKEMMSITPYNYIGYADQ